MFDVFKYAYQLWGTMSKADIRNQCFNGNITKEQYKEITGEEYV